MWFGHFLGTLWTLFWQEVSKKCPSLHRAVAPILAEMNVVHILSCESPFHTFKPSFRLQPRWGVIQCLPYVVTSEVKNESWRRPRRPHLITFEVEIGNSWADLQFAFESRRPTDRQTSCMGRSRVMACLLSSSKLLSKLKPNPFLSSVVVVTGMPCSSDA